ncbi:MAG TPA: prepilin-type N-terminal cleavage/methylation domain-containing protein [Thiopseudomonas sp.]|nr:prepilin-type N-terminal cleavage/methylation domain-containing protein [Thiopseudomonas sp.]
MDVQRRFTIIELMVTVTIAGILLAVAAPFFRDIIISSRLNTGTSLYLSTQDAVNNQMQS